MEDNKYEIKTDDQTSGLERMDMNMPVTDLINFNHDPKAELGLDLTKEIVVNVPTEESVIETVKKAVGMQLIRSYLVKPLPEKMIKKEVTEPIPNGNIDEDGAITYDEVKTGVKEFPSEFREGVLIMKPFDKSGIKYIDEELQEGDTIIYNSRAGRPYDLYKDTILLTGFDIVAVANK